MFRSHATSKLLNIGIEHIFQRAIFRLIESPFLLFKFPIVLVSILTFVGRNYICSIPNLLKLLIGHTFMNYVHELYCLNLFTYFHELFMNYYIMDEEATII